MRIGPRLKFFTYLSFSVLLGTGCSSQSPKTSQDVFEINRQQAATIKSLDREIQRLNTEISSLHQGAASDLQQAKTNLENRLTSEVLSGNLSVDVQDKGVVVTVLDKVLFAPGQAELKDSAMETLLTVAQILNGEAHDHFVYIEGHTDNQPIRYSGWKSNWELSSARAMEVLHFFIGRAEVGPERLAATGFGEYRPVVSNDSAAGQTKNRRVEIVISPKKVSEA